MLISKKAHRLVLYERALLIRLGVVQVFIVSVLTALYIYIILVIAFFVLSSLTSICGSIKYSKEAKLYYFPVILVYTLFKLRYVFVFLLMYGSLYSIIKLIIFNRQVIFNLHHFISTIVGFFIIYRFFKRGLGEGIRIEFFTLSETKYVYPFWKIGVLSLMGSFLFAVLFKAVWDMRFLGIAIRLYKNKYKDIIDRIVI